MANNLIVSYDLHNPGQNYEDVIAAIKELGSWARTSQSAWYVDSAYTAEQAKNRIVKHMDANDKLLVVNASANNCAWHNLADKVAELILKHWSL